MPAAFESAVVAEKQRGDSLLQLTKQEHAYALAELQASCELSEEALQHAQNRASRAAQRTSQPEEGVAAKQEREEMILRLGGTNGCPAGAGGIAPPSPRKDSRIERTDRSAARAGPASNRRGSPSNRRGTSTRNRSKIGLLGGSFWIWLRTSTTAFPLGPRNLAAAVGSHNTSSMSSDSNRRTRPGSSAWIWPPRNTSSVSAQLRKIGVRAPADYDRRLTEAPIM